MESGLAGETALPGLGLIPVAIRELCASGGALQGLATGSTALQKSRLMAEVKGKPSR
jgi:hypothetical protein